jgi:ribosomal protein S18 acetylase RimI-like enzyme
VSDAGAVRVPSDLVCVADHAVEKEETTMALLDGPPIAAGAAPQAGAVRATPGRLAGVTVGLAAPAEHPAIVGVVARGMRDNPLHVAVHGEDPALRLRRLRRLFAGALDVLDWPLLVARRDDGTIVGVCGMAPPGACQPGGGRQLRLLPHLLALGPGVVGRTGRWMGAWKARDLPERHWHLGPVAVDAGLQGQGIGSLMLAHYCERADAAGEVTYLETDKASNVRFYERFGFAVVGELDVLDVPNWFMRRAPGAGR